MRAVYLSSEIDIFSRSTSFVEMTEVPYKPIAPVD